MYVPMNKFRGFSLPLSQLIGMFQVSTYLSTLQPRENFLLTRDLSSSPALALLLFSDATKLTL